MLNLFINAQLDKPIGIVEVIDTDKVHRIIIHLNYKTTWADVESIMPLVAPDGETLLGWTLNTIGFHKKNKKHIK